LVAQAKPPRSAAFASAFFEGKRRGETKTQIAPQLQTRAAMRLNRMNTPSQMNPLSPLTQQSKGKSNVRLAVISIIALHAVFFGGLLLQGCKPKTIDSGLAGGGTTSPLTNELAPLTPTNAAPFGSETTPSGLAGQPFGQPAQPLTPSAPTNTAWPPTTLPPVDSFPANPSNPPGGTTEYSIKSGDIPARIAKDHGISLNALLQANPGLEPKKLKVGQKIQIPAPAAPSGGAAPGAEPSADKALIHVVKTGENLTKIAKSYGVSVKELRAANNLKTDRINVGQKLKVPAGKPAAAPADSGAAGTTASLPPAGGNGAPR
jgi:LysM repeat protein